MFSKRPYGKSQLLNILGHKLCEAFKHSAPAIMVYMVWLSGPKANRAWLAYFNVAGGTSYLLPSRTKVENGEQEQRAFIRPRQRRHKSSATCEFIFTLAVPGCRWNNYRRRFRSQKPVQAASRLTDTASKSIVMAKQPAAVE